MLNLSFKRGGIAVAAAAVLSLGVAAPGFAGDRKGPDKMMPETGVKLMAELSGANEVPGPGDEDGQGMFSARLNPGSGQMCYEITVDNIDDVTGAHIHFGAEGVSGDIALTFAKSFEDGIARDCMTVGKDLALDIIRRPNDFYVNVHDEDFPAGAIRGQIMK